MNHAAFTCESASVLSQCRREIKTQGPAAYGLCVGLDMIRLGLVAFAKRAIELDDQEMLDVCQQLCLIHEVEATDPRRQATND